MKKNIGMIGLLFVFLLSCSGLDKGTEKKEIKVATAANMQFAIKEIAEAFSEETGIKCDIIIGSSGKLTAQIKEGAPYDLFISANLFYPEKLAEEGKTEGDIKVYALGKLVIWSTDKEISLELENLTSPNIKHIALANTETAPYGTAALEVLRNLPFYDEIQSKFVFGESISQTNQFITTGSAEIGFTALSTVLSSEGKNIGNWKMIDKELYAPIQQGAVRINTGNPHTALFYDFLSSTKARAILVDYGYDINY